jgi:hypothetical protein
MVHTQTVSTQWQAVESHTHSGHETVSAGVQTTGARWRIRTGARSRERGSEMLVHYGWLCCRERPWPRRRMAIRKYPLVRAV